MARRLHEGPLMEPKKETELTKCHEMLKSFRNGMLVTRSLDGGFHGRPMHIAELSQNLTITFMTGLNTTKVDEILADPSVCLTLQDDGAFVTVMGQAAIVTDLEERRRVFSLPSEAWFDGPEDPNAALIRIRPRTIEYWDSSGVNALKVVFEMAKAVVTGETPKTNEKQHGTVHL